MTKTLTAVVAHILVVVALLTTFGILGLARNESEGADKFTGELERNVKLRVLENDTAKEMGYLDELLDAFNKKYASYGIRQRTPTWISISIWKRTVRTVTVPISYIKRTTL